MARLKGRDSLDDIRDQLRRDFRAANLVSLHARFYSAAPPEAKLNAAVALNHFYKAAGKLRSRESEFNNRARPSTAAPSLMSHLRSEKHFTALREFSHAKEGLLGINAAIGRSIIRLIEKDIDISARAPVRAAPAATI